MTGAGLRQGQSKAGLVPAALERADLTDPHLAEHHGLAAERERLERHHALMRLARHRRYFFFAGFLAGFFARALGLAAATGFADVFALAALFFAAGAT